MNRAVFGPEYQNGYLLQCIEEDFDDGLLLIDTTGELAEAAADRAPVEGTFYFDPADIEYPSGFNVLDGVPDADRHKVAKDICAFFDVLFPEGPSTLSRARSNYLLLNCLRLLLDAPRPNVLSIPRLLSDSNFRDACLRHCADPVVRDFWKEEFPNWKDDDTVPFKAKIGDLLTSPLVRNIIGQEHSTFSFDPRHIIIANLDRRTLGDATAFLLATLFLSRSKGQTYISDTGFLATDTLAGLLQQNRFTLSVRNLATLPVKLRQAILSVKDKTAFQVTEEDAELLAFYFSGVQNSSILSSLDPYEARNTAGPIDTTAPPAFDRLEAVKRRSRASFTRPRATVERTIRRYFAD